MYIAGAIRSHLVLMTMNHRNDDGSLSSRYGESLQIHDIKNGINYISESNSQSQKIWELFQYVRGEIQHEHTLLLGRVSWYITCQSFLITVYAVTYSNSRQPNWFSNFVLPLLAVIVSILAYFMIEGATKTINMWGTMRTKLVSVSAPSPGHGLDPVIIPRWRSDAKTRDFIHERALWFPRFIPIVFSAFWILVSIASSKFPWLQPVLHGKP